MADSNAYEAVIADLERQRDEIDAMISRLRAMSGTQMTPARDPGEVRYEDQGNAPLSNKKNPYLGMKVADAAKIVLQENRDKMSPAEITAKLEAGGLPVASSNTVASVLHRRSREAGDIVSPKRGYWGLKEWYPGRSFSKRQDDDKEDPTETNGPEQRAEPPRIVPLRSSDQT